MVNFFPFANQSAFGADVSLQWDANTESTLAGYRIYYGLSSGTYPTMLDVGNHTSCVISDLVEGEEYFFVATAYDTSGNESGYSNQVSCTVVDSTNSTIIDNGDLDTSYTGTWTASGAPDYYGTNSLYSRDGAAYTWSFQPDATGYYQVAMWWTEWSSRSNGVPVSIAHDGGTARLNVNQQINGGQWNDLGKYLFEAGVRYNVTLSAPNPYPTSYCADAVRFTFVEEAAVPSNEPPVAKDDSAATQMNKSVVISVLSNDTDNDGSLDSSSCTVVSEPARGYVSVGSNGTVTYTPQANFSGTDSFTYTVRDNEGALSNEATVTITVSAIAAGSEIIIDNGANGTSSTGTWTVSSAAGCYGSNSLRSRDGATSTWSFIPSESGSYQVAMWWTEYSSRSTNVPITIRHSGGSSTVYVNQQQSGGQWNDLGTYTFTAGTEYILTLSAPDSYPTSYCADAVKFTPASSSGSKEMVIDNEDSGTSSTGTWSVSNAAGCYGSNSLWSRDGATYTWSFIPSESGSYQVAMWWTEYSSRSTNVPITIRHSGGSSAVYVNQQQSGGQWNDLGTYRFTAGTEYSLTLSAPDPWPTSYCADAVKFVFADDGPAPVENQPPVAGDDTAETAMDTALTIEVLANDYDSDGTLDPSTCAVSGTSLNGGALSVNYDGSITYTPKDGFIGTDSFVYTVNDNEGAMSNEAAVTVAVTADSSGAVEIIIDNGDSETSSTGTWSVSSGDGYYGDNSLWSRDGAVYTWSFTPPVSGYYDVFMWWASYPSRSADVPIDIAYSGGSASVHVDQKIDGGMWNMLGGYYFEAGRRYNVTLHAPDPWPVSYCADAVRFSLTGR
jgi:hypothetical protein